MRWIAWIASPPRPPDRPRARRERVFQRIYALFGSHATYGVFPDVVPFLTWARRKGIVTGIISNADERYGDGILPMLDLSEHLDFNVFARDVNAMKPDPRIFDAAIEKANVARSALHGADASSPLAPEDVLHVGNSFSKDFVGAKDFGMRAVLLDRFGGSEGDDWRSRGAPVVRDLTEMLEHVARRVGCGSRRRHGEWFVGTPGTDFPRQAGRGDAAATTRIVRGDGSDREAPPRIPRAPVERG